MAGVPGAGPGSQLGPRRALQQSHSPEAEMRCARPSPRHCRESDRACALGRRRRRRRRPSRGSGASERRAEDREAVRASAVGDPEPVRAARGTERLLAWGPLSGLAGRLGSFPSLGPAWRAGPAITHNVFRGFRGPLPPIRGVW